MTSRKVATARRCRVGPACAYPAIRGGWPTALVSKAGSRSKRDKAIEQCRTDLTTLSLLIPPRLEAPPAAGLFIYRKSARSSAVTQRESAPTSNGYQKRP